MHGQMKLMKRWRFIKVANGYQLGIQLIINGSVSIILQYPLIFDNKTIMKEYVRDGIQKHFYLIKGGDVAWISGYVFKLISNDYLVKREL